MANAMGRKAASGKAASPASWEPSIKYLLVLLLLEIAAVAALRSFTHHGG